MKSIILKRKGNIKRNSSYSSSSSTSNKFKSHNEYKLLNPPSCGKPFTETNLHGMLTELLADNGCNEGDAASTEPIRQNSNANLLVNAASARKINPGDIKKLMPDSRVKAKCTIASKRTVLKSEFVLDGKPYYEVGQRITYFASKLSRKLLNSLVNRRANEGITDNNVRVISKYPEKTVNIHSIDNHEISSIPLVTAGGGVASTT